MSVASFSNIYPEIHLLAPGTAINSSVPGGGIASKQGTSMATPHVAGAWAVMKQREPGASVSSVLDNLQSTAMPVDDFRVSGIETAMPRIIRFTISLFGAIALLFAMSTVDVDVADAKKSKSTKTEAKFVSWDPASKMMTVKVKKTGKKAKQATLRLKTGKEAAFRVKPEGSVSPR